LVSASVPRNLSHSSGIPASGRTGPSSLMAQSPTPCLRRASRKKKIIKNIASSLGASDRATRTTRRSVWCGLGFRVPVRALKLKPLLKCEIIIQINIKQTKLHASIQHLAFKISIISAISGTRPVVTYTAHGGRRGTRAHVRKT
jgi:hypothetical protein